MLADCALSTPQSHRSSRPRSVYCVLCVFVSVMAGSTLLPTHVLPAVKPQRPSTDSWSWHLDRRGVLQAHEVCQHDNVQEPSPTEENAVLPERVPQRDRHWPVARCQALFGGRTAYRFAS
jgi:hypothetical protein